MLLDMPKEYQRGFATFLGCHIDLSLRPFIPRPETAQMTEAAIKEIQERSANPPNIVSVVHDRELLKLLAATPPYDQPFSNVISCLDLFAGSGAIGIALLKHIKNIRVDFGEKNPVFLKQIKINLDKNSILQERYGLIKTDIFSKVFFKYDYILANPPYVAEKRKNEVQPSVLKFEPREALFAGPDGLDVIKVFLAQAKNYLRRGGAIFMEFDPLQKKDIKAILKKHNYGRWQFFRDLNNFWRWVKIIPFPKNGRPSKKWE